MGVSVRRMTLSAVLAVATLLSTGLVGADVAEATPFAYVTNEGGGVSQFDALGSGLLTPLTPHTIMAGTNPRGIAMGADGKSLYVANSTSANAMSQYSVGSDGKLTPKTPPTVNTDPDADQRVVYIAASPNGRDVYANSGYNGVGGGAIFQYTVQTDGTLAAKSPSYVFSGESGGLVVSPDGKSVYETGETNTVRQYDVSATDGSLSPKNPASVTGANGAFHLAVAPNGKTLYVGNYGSPGSVSQFTIDAGGKLTAKLPATIAAGNGALEPAVSPDGKNLYVTNADAGTVSQYDIGTDGSLTAKTPATVAAGASPVGVGVSADGSSVYVADRSLTGQVFQFDVGAGGALSPKSVASVAAGQYPRAIAVTPGGSPPDLIAPTITTIPTAPPPPPPPAAPPPSPPSEVDTTAPAAKLFGAAQRLARSVAVRVSCTTEACSAKTVASVRVPKTRTRAAKTYKLTAVRTVIGKGKTVTIRLKLSTAAHTAIRGALRAGKRVVAKVKLTVVDAAGNTRTLSRGITLRRA
jgi:6-phosphogluconolactonase (cycloisomerase 2 family)